MKNIGLLAFSMLLSVFAVYSCSKEKQLSAAEYEALQKRIDADEDVAMARNYFFAHSRIVASFSTQEFDALMTKVKSCGYSAFTAPLTDLNNCLADTPGGERFVEGMKMIRSYENMVKSIKQKYPEFARLKTEDRTTLLIRPITIEQTKDLLSSRTQKK